MKPQINRVLPQNTTIICGFLEVNSTRLLTLNFLIMNNNSQISPTKFRAMTGIFTALICLLLSSCTKEYTIKQNGDIDWILYLIQLVTCIKPTDLQALISDLTSETLDVVITWRESPTAYEYRIINTKYLNEPFATATDITLYTTKNWVVLKNLSPKTTYTFRISSVCHEDSATPWAEISFTTSK